MYPQMLLIFTCLEVGKLVTDFRSVQRKALLLISMSGAVLTSLLCQNPASMCSSQ